MKTAQYKLIIIIIIIIIITNLQHFFKFSYAYWLIASDNMREEHVTDEMFQFSLIAKLVPHVETVAASKMDFLTIRIVKNSLGRKWNRFKQLATQTPVIISASITLNSY